MKKSTITCLLILICAFFPASHVFSQATVSVDSIKSMLIKDWQRAKEYTQEYMTAMPADKYSFKANDSIRTFAQQLLHLTQANVFLSAAGTGAKPKPTAGDLEKIASAQSADSVQYYVNNSYDFVINGIKNMSTTSLLEPVTLNMGRPITATRLGWIMKAFEHQTHHRGQTTIYLRLAGVHPPNEKLF